MHIHAEQIHAEGLRKRYGDAYALEGFDLSVPAGTLCDAGVAGNRGGVEPVVLHGDRGAGAVRQPGRGGDVLGECARGAMAVGWPLVLPAVFVPLSVRRYGRLGN